MSSEFPDVWRWLQSLTPLQRVQALSLTNEVVATVIINLVYYERKEVWNQLKIWDSESFHVFIKEVKTNVISKRSNGKAKKRQRSMFKNMDMSRKPLKRSQFWQVQFATACDPKVVARSIAIGRGRTDSEKNELIRNRKKSVNSLCVLRSNDMVDNAVNLFHSSETNYVDTVAVSYDAVHNDNMAKLWSQLMTYSDGQFLQNGEKELDELPRDEWCASWFRRLPRFSFQSLVAGMLEIALLKAYSQREQPKKKKKNKGGRLQK